jgi:DNA repair exonuclease SbcCD nuclease subunit
MTRVFHCADLHLSERERTYSLNVLEDIVDLTKRHEPAWVLIAGDLFDSFADLEALRGEFRARMEQIPQACQVVYLPGNHEELERGAGRVEAMDLGRVTVKSETPFAYLRGEDLDIIAVPQQDGIAGYREWSVPPKEGRHRIVMVHGTVAGLSYAGLEDEEGAEAVDPDLFIRLEADYAALGHIHARRQERLGNTLLAYPGSARVWRRGEAGAHGLYCVRLGAHLSPEFLPLPRAGTYVELEIPLSLEGDVDADALPSDGWTRHDWVRLNLAGLVEDEHTVARNVERLEATFADRLRRLTVNRDAVTVLPGIASDPLAQRFLALWQKREPEDQDSRQAWLRARALALGEIRRALEAKS